MSILREGREVEASARKPSAAVALALLALAASPAAAGVDGAAVCKEGKATAAGRKAADLTRAVARNIKRPNAVKLADGSSRAQSRFTRAFTRAESRGGCGTVDDAARIEAKVDVFVADAIQQLSPCANGLLNLGTDIQDLTLGELGWQLVSEVQLPSGAVLTVGTFSGGTFSTLDAAGTARTIVLGEHAAVYWPPGYPNTLNSEAGFGHVHAAHVESGILSDTGEKLALNFGLPVVQHGEDASDWEELGYVGRNEMIAGGFDIVPTVNPCSVKDLTYGNFAWALARTNIRAITLLQRLAEQRGGQVTRVALRGGSKEGFATWMASATDDRIEVDGSGGFHLEDLVAALAVHETDWGCEGSGAGGATTADLLVFLDWLQNTPAGHALERCMSVARFKHLLHPRFVLIAGDVTAYGMHDGNYFPLGSESSFLEGFVERPWRYDRKPNETREGGFLRQARLRALLLEQLVSGAGYVDQVWPKVTVVQVETDDASRSFRVSAQISPSPQLVRSWWSHSDDRRWNDPENAPWYDVPMTLGQDEQWHSDWVATPPGDEVAYYVEAENTATIAGYVFPRRDASPVQFLWRLPELACPIEPPDWCQLK